MVRCAHADAGTIHHRARRADRGHGLGDGTLGIGAVGNIAFHEGAADRLRLVPAEGLVEVEDRDLGAGCRQCARRGAAQARRPAGDDRPLPLHIHCARSRVTAVSAGL
jgi:hypothetical protein